MLRLFAREVRARRLRQLTTRALRTHQLYSVLCELRPYSEAQDQYCRAGCQALHRLNSSHCALHQPYTVGLQQFIHYSTTPKAHKTFELKGSKEHNVLVLLFKLKMLFVLAACVYFTTKVQILTYNTCQIVMAYYRNGMMRIEILLTSIISTVCTTKEFW